MGTSIERQRAPKLRKRRLQFSFGVERRAPVIVIESFGRGSAGSRSERGDEKEEPGRPPQPHDRHFIRMTTEAASVEAWVWRTQS